MSVLDPDELGFAAERILSLAEAKASQLPSSAAEPQSLPAVAGSILADVAAKELQRRAKRSQYLPADLFNEAGWEILLALFVAEQTGQRMSLETACSTSPVAPTTALRYIAFMVANGLVQRSENPADVRHKVLGLTSKGMIAIRAALQSYVPDTAQ